MKGPYERLKYDLRRTWECPVCKRRERTAGTATFRHCPCQMQKLEGKPVVMLLVADGVQRLAPVVQPPGVSERVNAAATGGTADVNTGDESRVDPKTMNEVPSTEY